MDYGLGRFYAPDERDNEYPILSLLGNIPPVSDRKIRYWNPSGWWGDQGNKPHCVGYAWTHWVEDGPVTHKGVAPLINPVDVYNEAQKIDEWTGENYDGTSVRAGAKILVSKGLIESYHWAFDLDTTIDAILEKGPVVVGTNWYTEMFSPDNTTTIRARGGVAGGHAYELNGVNKPKERVRIKNSWGRNWGRNGHAWLPFEDLEKLINEWGEVCLAVENK